MAAAVDTLLAAINGRRPERPLRAPLVAALASEVEARDPREFLADPGARARALVPLARALRIDVLFADPGSGWNGEAMGLVADWADGWPPTLYPGRRMGAFDPGCDATRILADLLARLRAMLPAVALGVALTGPATLSADSGGTLSLVEAAGGVLVAARHVAECGAGAVMVRERGDAPVEPDVYAAATRPLWQSLRFFCCSGLLAVSAPGGSSWHAVLGTPSPFFPCLDPAATPPSGDGCFAVALRPGSAWLTAKARASIGGRCVLLTHTEDLLGHVAIRDAAATLA